MIKRGSIAIILPLTSIFISLSSCKNFKKPNNTTNNTKVGYSKEDLLTIQKAQSKGHKNIKVMISASDISATKEKIKNFGGSISYADDSYSYIIADIPTEYANILPEAIEPKGIGLDKEIPITPPKIIIEEKKQFSRSQILKMAENCTDKKCPFFPTYDLKFDSLKKIGRNGSGVKIAILDSGISGESSLFTKNANIINWQNFTAEGNLNIQKTEMVKDGILKGKYGFIKIGQIRADDGNYFVGSLEETKLKENPYLEFADFNNDGDSTDRFDVMIIKKNNTYIAYFDANDDANIEDESGVENYNDSFELLKVGNKKFPIIINEENNTLLSAHIGFDSIGHGTGLSTIIAGKDPFGIGVDGIAPSARLLAIKIYSYKTSIDIINRAIIYAVKNGADIINLSFNLPDALLESNSVTQSILNDISYKNKNIFVFSAGNSGPSITSAVNSSSLDNVIFAGAYTSFQTYSSIYGGESQDGYMVLPISSRGPSLLNGITPDIVAPGLTITESNSKKGEFESMIGTSVSGAMVTGAIALLLSNENDKLTDMHKIKKLILTNTYEIKEHYFNDQGNGAIDIDKVYNNLGENGSFNINIKNGIFLKGEIPEHYEFNFLIENNSMGRDCGKIEGLYNLISSIDWIEISSPNPTSLNCNLPKSIGINFKLNKLLPGIYETKILAKKLENNVTLKIPVTIIVPHSLTNTLKKEFTEKVKRGLLKRYFFYLPKNLDQVAFDAKLLGGGIRFYLTSPTRAKESFEITNTLAGNYSKGFMNPESGIWEIDIWGNPLYDFSDYSLMINALH